jgi:aminocarboxymuconate-semialdehyde decarboxylase
MRQAGMKRPWADDWLKEDGAFERELARLWFDTNVGDSRSLAFLVEIMGTDHLVMGTNFAGWDQQTSVKKGADIPGLADNARRLLGGARKAVLAAGTFTGAGENHMG